MDTIDGLSNAVMELNAKLMAMETTMNAKMMAMEQTQRVLTDTDVTEMGPSFYDMLVAVNDTVNANKAGTDKAMSHTWLIICGALVMFMHAGFSMLEAGCCRAGFAQSVLAKNLLNCCVSTLGWLVLGFPLAYGGILWAEDGCYWEGCGVFGSGLTAFGDDGVIAYDDGPLSWFFQWAFCMTAATIVSGAVAERLQIGGYCVFCLMMTSIIYPVVVSWTWNSDGFLYQAGYMDFAGSGIVHLTGGIGALIGTVMVKPRTGRFDGNEDDFAPHDVPMIVLGTIILWFGWYGFNCGSTLSMGMHQGYVAGIVAVNTTIAPAFGGMVVTFIRKAQMGKWMTTETCGGILAGLVSITAGCGNVPPWASVVIGSLGGVFYVVAADLLVKMQVDDPVQAFPVHGACGIWGVLAAVFFDFGVVSGNGTYHGWGCHEPTPDYGMGDALTTAFTFLGLNLVWTGALMGLTFGGLGAAGLLRVSKEAEKEGLDEHEFSPKAARTSASFQEFTAKAH
jgi:Amt family ammonium transporter